MEPKISASCSQPRSARGTTAEFKPRRPSQVPTDAHEQRRQAKRRSHHRPAATRKRLADSDQRPSRLASSSHQPAYQTSDRKQPEAWQHQAVCDPLVQLNQPWTQVSHYQHQQCSVPLAAAAHESARYSWPSHIMLPQQTPLISLAPSPPLPMSQPYPQPMSLARESSHAGQGSRRQVPQEIRPPTGYKGKQGSVSSRPQIALTHRRAKKVTRSEAKRALLELESHCFMLSNQVPSPAMTPLPPMKACHCTALHRQA